MELQIVNVCRVCTVSEQSDGPSTRPIIWFNIFDNCTLQGSTSLSEAMNILTGGSEIITPGDGLSEDICDICFNKLNEAYEFSCQISQNAERLRNIQTINYTKVNEVEPSAPAIVIEDEDDGNISIKSEAISQHSNDSNWEARMEPLTYTCEECQKQFNDYELYEHHVARCVSTQNTKPPPPLTMYKKLHSALTATKLKEYKCPECPKLFKLETQMLAHAKTHTSSGFVCDVCTKQFSNVSTLHMHRRIHDPSTWFSCEYCDKQFAQKGNKMTHIKRFHPDVVIPDDPVDAAALEKPFVCKYCLRRYAKDSTMKKHMKRAHGISRWGLKE